MDYEIIDTISVYALEKGDQVVINNEYTIIRTVDSDREDIDEVFVTFENLSSPAGDESAALFADDNIGYWVCY